MGLSEGRGYSTTYATCRLSNAHFDDGTYTQIARTKLNPSGQKNNTSRRQVRKNGSAMGRLTSKAILSRPPVTQGCSALGQESLATLGLGCGFLRSRFESFRCKAAGYSTSWPTPRKVSGSFSRMALSFYALATNSEPCSAGYLSHATMQRSSLTAPPHGPIKILMCSSREARSRQEVGPRM